MTKPAIFGWVISLAGFGLWLYGYFVAGHAPIFNWHEHAPWWIADYLPNLESESGMAIMFVGTAAMYWPTSG